MGDRHMISTNASYKLDSPPSDSISDMKFDNDNKILGLTSWDGSFTTYTFDDGFNRPSPPKTKKIPNEALLRFCFTSNGDVYIGGSSGRIYRITQNGDPKEVVEFNKGTNTGAHEGIISGLVFDEINNALFSSGSDEEIHCYDLSALETKTGFTTEKKKPIVRELQNEKPTNIALTNDSKYLVISTHKGKIFLMDINSNLNIISVNNEIAGFPSMCVATFGNNGVICSYVDGFVEIGTIGTASYGSSISFNSRKCMCHRDETSWAIYASNTVAVSPDGTHAVSGGGDGSLAFFNLSRKEKVAEEFNTTSKGTSSQKIPITSLCYLSDKCIAIGSGYDWQEGVELMKEKSFEVSIWIRQLGQKMIE